MGGGAKENDGRGARRQRLRRLTWIVGILGSVALLLFVLVLQDKDDNQHGSKGGRLRQLHHKGMRLLHDHENKLTSQFGWLTGDKRGGGGQNVAHQEMTPSEVLEAIVQAKLHLVDIRVNHNALPRSSNNNNNNEKRIDYEGSILGEFCRLQWSVHKAEPSKNPMFRELLAASPDCDAGNRVTMDLQQAARAARDYDDKSQHTWDGTDIPKLLNLTTVVFHESRCGSTLIANMAVAAGTTDASGAGAHRVYSESPPPVAALKHVCGEEYETCSPEVAATVFQDVIYLMSRSDDPHEQRVFFKMQSISSRNIDVFQQAFPKTPWLFVYRDPVQVLMSQLAYGPHRANCVAPQGRSRQFHLVQDIVNRVAVFNGEEKPSVQHIPHEDYCAVHLASITESAVQAVQSASSVSSSALAIPVNYNDLPRIFYDDILPGLLGIPHLPPAQYARVQAVSSQYSKGSGGRAGTFQGDSDKKNQLASEAVKRAAQRYLQASFDALEQAAQAAKQKLSAMRRSTPQQ